jgi:cytochrome c biogenesis protein CcmG/thiol:disulfide interchange protein DsbE
MTRLLLWAPLALFAAFAAVVATGLVRPQDNAIASRLIGEPMPRFALPQATAARPGLGSVDLAGGAPKLVNVFASWCLPCAIEAPQLDRLARAGVPVFGIAIRDRSVDLDRFLRRNGNPYRRIGLDKDSSVQLALGSSGVPETFVVDGRGVIRYQHIGEIRPENLPMIMRALERAR